MFFDWPYRGSRQNIQISSCLCLWRSELQLQDLSDDGGPTCSMTPQRRGHLPAGGTYLKEEEEDSHFCCPYICSMMNQAQDSNVDPGHDQDTRGDKPSD